jgi:hypothetical protein
MHFPDAIMAHKYPVASTALGGVMVGWLGACKPPGPPIPDFLGPPTKFVLGGALIGGMAFVVLILLLVVAWERRRQWLGMAWLVPLFAGLGAVTIGHGELLDWAFGGVVAGWPPGLRVLLGCTVGGLAWGGSALAIQRAAGTRPPDAEPGAAADGGA